jgi:hypothetical protein
MKKTNHGILGICPYIIQYLGDNNKFLLGFVP